MTNKELEKEIKELRAMLEEHLKPRLCGEMCEARKRMNDCDWEEIINICRNRADYFDLDDSKEIELLSGEIVHAKIIGTNHDIMENGNYAPVTLMFTIDGEYEMNEECTNQGGWFGSKMNTVYMERIYKLLPDDVKKYIVPVVKTASVGDGSEQLERKLNKLFLLSEVEYSNTTEYSAQGEGEQYAYFKKGGKLPAKWQWLRSPYPPITSFFSFVNYFGNGYYNVANNSYGVCPCFALSNI